MRIIFKNSSNHLKAFVERDPEERDLVKMEIRLRDVTGALNENDLSIKGFQMALGKNDKDFYKLSLFITLLKFKFHNIT